MSQTVSVSHAMQVWGGTLTVLDGSNTSRHVGTTKVLVGRSEICDLVIRDQSKTASELHAELIATETGVRVRDLGSTNGIYINGIRCKEAFLDRPVTIHIGGCALSFVPTPISVEVATAPAFGGLIAISTVMQKLFGVLHKLASNELNVLIAGETGTGKELVAQGIHAVGRRSNRPITVIDCSALSPQLVASELFGHERGAFTGAFARRESPFIESAGGTIFLDEIGELPLELQPQLLRVLEERRVKAVGSNTYRPVDVRILAASRRNLEEEVNAGRFRSDLYYRLNGILVEVPPLRDRREDIPVLIEWFSRCAGRPGDTGRLSKNARERLYAYDWPGNVRELRRAIESALEMADPVGPIELVASFAKSRSREGRTHRHHLKMIEDAEVRFWSELHEDCSGNQTAMAKLSGCSRSKVQDKLTKYLPHVVSEAGND